MTEERFHFVIIDDNKLDLFIASTVINKTGLAAQITTFLNSPEALDFLCKHNYNEGNRLFVFIDIHMPLLNGIELFKELNEKLSAYIVENKCIISFLSSSINQADFKDIDSVGAKFKYFSKPLVLDSFREILSFIEESTKSN